MAESVQQPVGQANKNEVVLEIVMVSSMSPTVSLDYLQLFLVFLRFSSETTQNKTTLYAQARVGGGGSA